MITKLRSRTLAQRIAEAEKFYRDRKLATDDVRGLEEMVTGRQAYFGYGWKATDKAALARAVQSIRDVIGPVKGRAAQLGVPDGQGGTFDIPAAGDPTMWYVRFRHSVPARMPAGVEEATAIELDAVCRRFA